MSAVQLSSLLILLYCTKAKNSYNKNSIRTYQESYLQPIMIQTPKMEKLVLHEVTNYAAPRS